MVQSEDFAGRPDFESFQHIGGDDGISFCTYNARWKMHKKLARTALRQFTNVSESNKHLYKLYLLHKIFKKMFEA